jgi:hypothetical protein
LVESSVAIRDPGSFKRITDSNWPRFASIICLAFIRVSLGVVVRLF